MAKTPRVFNLTTRSYPKRRAAERAIANCAAAWVEFGVSIRNLTLSESIAARAEQVRMREPLPLTEIHGLRFEPPLNGIAVAKRGSKLIWQAHEFAAGAMA